MFKLFTEALAAWKGQRDMTKESYETAFGTAPSVQRGIRTSPSIGEPQEERIRFRAYLLAEAAGFPAGRADEFWHQAEKEIRSGKNR